MLLLATVVLIWWGTEVTLAAAGVLEVVEAVLVRVV